MRGDVRPRRNTRPNRAPCKSDRGRSGVSVRDEKERDVIGLEGKNALVTGAGRGIGEATARKLSHPAARGFW